MSSWFGAGLSIGEILGLSKSLSFWAIKRRDEQPGYIASEGRMIDTRNLEWSRGLVEVQELRKAKSALPLTCSVDSTHILRYLILFILA
jgi:hypothetical protein